MKEKPTMQDVLAEITPAQMEKIRSEIKEVKSILHRAPDRTEQVMTAYGVIDEVNRIQIEELQQKPSCSKGCSFCCSIAVKIVPSEARVILEYCKENNIHIDEDRLEKQSFIRDDTEWILHPEKKCVFLDGNLCSIYPVRPSACRNHFVFGDPKLQCDTDGEGTGEDQPQMFNIKSYIAIIALFDEEPLDYMPKILLNEIDNEQQPYTHRNSS